MAKAAGHKYSQHEIDALARCLLPEIQNFLKARRNKEFEEWKAQRVRRTKRKRAYDKSGGIVNDTAAFALALKIY